MAVGVARIVAAVALATAVAVAAPAAASSGETPTLTVSGAGTRSVAVDLPGGIATGAPASIRVESGGTYAGLLIRDRNGKVLAGWLSVFTPRLKTRVPVQLGDPRMIVRGQYLLTLVSDGPTQIQVPLESGRDVLVRPGVANRTVTLLAALPSTAERALEVHLPPATYSAGYLVHLQSSSSAWASGGRACITRQRGTCSDGAHLSWLQGGPPPTTGRRVVTQAYGEASLRVPPGSSAHVREFAVGSDVASVVVALLVR